MDEKEVNENQDEINPKILSTVFVVKIIQAYEIKRETFWFKFLVLHQ